MKLEAKEFSNERTEMIKINQAGKIVYRPCLLLTFPKCVDVWVTFKNDPNNHSFDTEKNPKKTCLNGLPKHD